MSAMQSKAAMAGMGTGTYFVLGPNGYAPVIAEGRRFVTRDGVPLDGELAVREALERDGEVWTEWAAERKP